MPLFYSVTATLIILIALVGTLLGAGDLSVYVMGGLLLSALAHIMLILERKT